MIKKATKVRIVRATRPPSNLVVMSLMAALLVVGAPALVSIIDDSMIYDMDSSAPFIEKDTPYGPLSKRISGSMPVGTDVSLSYVKGSDNNGVHLITLNTISSAQYVGSVEHIFIDNSTFSKGVTKVILHFDDASDIASVRFSTNLPDQSYTYLTMSKVGSDSFELEIDRFLYAKLSDTGHDPQLQIIFIEGAFSGLLSFSSEVEYVYSLDYGSLIIGATGALLLICALFATPYFSILGGYTGKKSWRSRR